MALVEAITEPTVREFSGEEVAFLEFFNGLTQEGGMGTEFPPLEVPKDAYARKMGLERTDDELQQIGAKATELAVDVFLEDPETEGLLTELHDEIDRFDSVKSPGTYSARAKVWGHWIAILTNGTEHTEGLNLLQFDGEIAADDTRTSQ